MSGVTSDFSAFSSPPSMPDTGVMYPDGSPPPPFEPITPVSPTGTVKPVDAMAKVTQVLVSLTTACFGVGVVTSLIYARSIRSLQAGSSTLERVLDIESIDVALAISGLGLLVFSGIATMVWLYTLTKNTEVLGVGNLEHAPKWAILGWIVPFLNFVRPLHMMQQGWRLTASRSQPTVSPPQLFRQWWGLFIASGLIGRFATQGGMTPTLDQLAFNSYSGAVSSVLLVGAGVLFVIAVGRLTTRHDALVDEAIVAPVSVFG